MSILLDMDEVLAALVTAVNTYYNTLHGTNFRREDYTTYNWWETWGSTYEEADRICHQFITGPESDSVKPIPGSVEGVTKLKKDYRLIVATSRRYEYEALTKAWLEKHFGNDAFFQIYLLNQYGEGLKRRKSEVAVEVGARLAVDDLVRHAKDYQSVGVPCLILDAPWNAKEIIPDSAKRVFSWEEILKEVYCKR